MKKIGNPQTIQILNKSENIKKIYKIKKSDICLFGSNSKLHKNFKAFRPVVTCDTYTICGFAQKQCIKYQGLIFLSQAVHLFNSLSVKKYYKDPIYFNVN